MYEEGEHLLRIPRGAPTLLPTPELCLKECDKGCCLKPKDLSHDCARECQIKCTRHCPPIFKYGQVPGAALVKLIPPRRCRFPIVRLKYKTLGGGKNDYYNAGALCQVCMETAGGFQAFKVCPHSDEERTMKVSLTLMEIAFAVQEQGYKIAKVEKVLFWAHYSEGDFDPILGALARTKLTSDVTDINLEDPEQREAKAAQLRRETGFDITAESLQSNEALKACSKLSICAAIGGYACLL